MGVCTWSPRLDALGNSVRGVRFCEKFGQAFAVHRFDTLRGVCEAANYSATEPLARRRFAEHFRTGTLGSSAPQIRARRLL